MAFLKLTFLINFVKFLPFTALSSNSAKALRIRGPAWALLGNWTEARKDLLLAQQIDYDDNVQAKLKNIQGV